MWPLLRRPAVRRLGVGAATALATGITLHQRALAEEAPPPQQWLWTFDGIRLTRDEATGEVVYANECTGELLAGRPATVPAEAYAQRKRSPPHPDWGEAARATKASRHVLLIRHSQYRLDGASDGERTLTDLGERQAALLGQRLATIHAADEGAFKAFALNQLQSSELTRAIQTADILAPWLPHAVRSRDGVLDEGRPCLPEPAPRHRHAYTDRNGDAERIERAYRTICRKPPAEQKADTHEVVVCHANVIRFVVCRALQLPPEAWLRMSLPHASLTYIVVRPTGDVSLKALGDSGHLPPEMVTT